MSFASVHRLLLPVLVLLVSIGCSALLGDLSGTRCNADGRCGEGYFCDAATQTCQAGEAQCANVTACVSGDGCCPEGCVGGDDLDCPRCGDAKIDEMLGERCDDGNFDNGDGCDPTCRYGNQLSRLSGRPGSYAFADGVGAAVRFTTPYAIVRIGETLYVADRDTPTIRAVDLTSFAVRTVAGTPNHGWVINGTGGAAAFYGPNSIAWVGGSVNALFVADFDVLRRLDPVTGAVQTSSIAIDLDTALAGRGDALLIYTREHGVRRFDPVAGATQVLTQPAAIVAARDGASDACGGLAPYADDYLLSCGSVVLRGHTDGGVSPFAGSAQFAGCDVGDGGTLGALFRGTTGLVTRAESTGTPTVFVADETCRTISELKDGRVTRIAGLPGIAGTANGPVASATFRRPASLELGANAASLFVADPGAGTIRTLEGGRVSTVAGTASKGTATTAYDAGQDSTYGFISPGLVLDDAAGALYVLESRDGTLWSIDLENGNPAPLAKPTASADPTGFRALAQIRDTLYLSHVSGGIWQLLRSGTSKLQLFAGVPGATDAKDGPLLSAQLAPGAMTACGDELFFVDLGSRTVRRIREGQVVTLAGGNTTGTSAVIDGVGAAARFHSPTALACTDAAVFVIDADGTVIRRVDRVTGEVETIAGEPLIAQTRDGEKGTSRLAAAYSLATDGRVLLVGVSEGPYFSPGESPRPPTGPLLRMIELDAGMRVTTMIGQQSQWTFLEGTGLDARLHSPAALAYSEARGAFFGYDDGEGVFFRVD